MVSNAENNHMPNVGNMVYVEYEELFLEGTE